MNAQRETSRDDHHHLLDLAGRLARWVAWLFFAAACWAAATGMTDTVVVESGTMTLSVDIESVADLVSSPNPMRSGGIRSGCQF
jgi:hypothetical protein